MAKPRLVAPRPARTGTLPSVDAVVVRERPTESLLCLRPAAIAAAARRFVEAFPGDVLYAVKCNPEPRVLRAVWAGGVRHFDCASLPEIALVRRVLPGAALHFMHPVKARAAIHAAFTEHGVTDFAFDSRDELAKILQETVPVGLVGAPPTLGLFVRLAVAQGGAYDLSGKFGVSAAGAAELLRAARPHAARLGIAFHVGSQCLDPGAYAGALRVAAAAGVGPAVRLWAEPGRALVAAGGSVVVQVELRRGDALYVNDGVHGSLSDAGRPGFRFPARRIRADGVGEDGAPLREFTLFGPTCDSADQMPGPFLLPADMREGDWVELGQLGAYGACLRTRFNGFDSALTIDVADPPMLATPGYDG